MKVSVTLPTYNERGNIVDFIEAIQSYLIPESFGYEMVSYESGG